MKSISQTIRRPAANNKSSGNEPPRVLQAPRCRTADSRLRYGSVPSLQPPRPPPARTPPRPTPPAGRTPAGARGAAALSPPPPEGPALPGSASRSATLRAASRQSALGPAPPSRRPGRGPHPCSSSSRAGLACRAPDPAPPAGCLPPPFFRMPLMGARPAVPAVETAGTEGASMAAPPDSFRSPPRPAPSRTASDPPAPDEYRSAFSVAPPGGRRTAAVSACLRCSCATAAGRRAPTAGSCACTGLRARVGLWHAHGASRTCPVTEGVQCHARSGTHGPFVRLPGRRAAPSSHLCPHSCPHPSQNSAGRCQARLGERCLRNWGG